MSPVETPSSRERFFINSLFAPEVSQRTRGEEKAGMRAVGHFCTHNDDGLPRWLETVEEASKQHSHLKAGAKEAKAWTKVMQTLQSLTTPSEPEDDRHVSRSSSGAVECARGGKQS